MITLVTGGSGSGKSEYAEHLVLQSGSIRRCYVATMIAYGTEGREKVLRHQMLRRGKGFITIEQPRDVGQIVLEPPEDAGKGEMAPEPPGDGGKRAMTPAPAVLLECVSNLAANEMFGGTPEDNGDMDVSRLAEKIEADILCLSRQARDMVIVTNEVDRDGLVYDRETMEYIRLMGLLNKRLASMADRVVEVVCGIPVMLKQAGGN